MRLKHLPKDFTQARPVLQRVEQAGFQAYFVGGSVRDTILGDHIHDVDIASSAYPQEIKSLFHRTVDTGIEHGTVMVLYHGRGYEITTFRTESGYQDYRRPDHVTFVRSLSEDLKRRDFTINAFAMRENGDVTDLFHGMDDIKKRLIRAVGDPNQRFNEDALRMMRAVRFASKLNFRIEPKTLAAIKKHSPLLKKIAVERIHSEFVKMMLGQAPKVGLLQMLKTNLYQFVPVFNRYFHDLNQILSIPNLKLDNEDQVWALIAYMFDDRKKQINQLLKAWKSSNEVIRNVNLIILALNRMKSNQLDAMTMFKVGYDALCDANHIADMLGFGMSHQQIKDDYQSLPITSRNQLKINGKILIKDHILKPGPMLGKVLNTIESNVINGKVANDKAKLIQLAQKMSGMNK
ncbi:CCA-adding enzyme [Philodulcilactobacillus myokoensis]|uniref:CCA-adding enzyme n=1 Tax=Philodulcilactobacillus myokoensis TaxID=2929573 RepID=A0A9W6ET99_9LACO|nr:CCA tRNA nucleotidyltransferase [Philodulcilactobacillus myokoensis]GLB46884.1 CCA-adding enzyme [Philodulcilactobacillus myokoensis]